MTAAASLLTEVQAVIFRSAENGHRLHVATGVGQVSPPGCAGKFATVQAELLYPAVEVVPVGTTMTNRLHESLALLHQALAAKQLVDQLSKADRDRLCQRCSSDLTPLRVRRSRGLAVAQ